ncbi:MAG: DUF1343 domain-containing protein, partial [Spirochaetes bacterium]|nr:DUF1343 domain-containing protein [Spirochaetota bacterium]
MNQRAARAITAVMIALFAAHCAGEAHYHLRTDGRRVRTGLERFIASKAKKYRGKSAALVTNHSGYDFDLKQNIQLLRDKGIKISMVFAPEHGVYGYMDDIDRRGWWYDGTIRCTVYNLYGINRGFLRYLLGLSDIVIFDIQDMGMRCYTYITNLKDVIDALDGLNRELIVLDRPNPVG